MSSHVSSEELIKKIKARLAEQNEVIREQQIQIHDQQQKIGELEKQIADMSQADQERSDIMHRLAELVE